MMLPDHTDHSPKQLCHVRGFYVSIGQGAFSPYLYISILRTLVAEPNRLGSRLFLANVTTPERRSYTVPDLKNRYTQVVVPVGNFSVSYTAEIYLNIYRAYPETGH
jgi:hypothetical protein